MFDNLDKLTSEQMATQCRMAADLASKTGLDLTTFLKRILGPEKYAQVEARIQEEDTRKKASVDRAQSLVRDFASKQSILKGKEWLLAYRHTYRAIRGLDIDIDIADAALMAGISERELQTWDTTDDQLLDEYDKAVRAEFGGTANVFDLSNLETSYVGEGQCNFYYSIPDGKQVVLYIRRVREYIVESGTPIPDDRLAEIIEIMG